MKQGDLNLVNAELNPVRLLLSLVAAHHIVHVSRIRVKLSKVKAGGSFETSRNHLSSDEEPHPIRTKSLITRCDSLKTCKMLLLAAACRPIQWPTTFAEPHGWQKFHVHPETGEATHQHASNDYSTKHYMPYIAHSLRGHYSRSSSAIVFLAWSFLSILNMQRLRKGTISNKHDITQFRECVSEK